MTHRLAWPLLGLFGVLMLGTLTLTILAQDTGVILPIMLPVSAAPVVGAIVAWRRPENPIGWLLLTIGLLWAADGLCAEYAQLAVVTSPGLLPGGVLFGWFGSWLDLPALTLVAFIILLFPTGGLPSPRWRPVVWLIGAFLLSDLVLTMFAPGPLYEGITPLPANNPFGIEAVGPILRFVFPLVPPVACLPAIASIVLRFRRAGLVQREQLKWLVYSAAAFPTLIAISDQRTRLPADLQPLYPGALLFGVAVAGVPVAIGVAVLRYRLYDIDLIIRRTLVYGLLTLGLGATYWFSVAVLQQLVRPLTQGSDLAIVGSTLAVAALFQPFRRRIQLVVDRRFYRERYDAVRTLESFSARLRDEIDLDALGSELLAAVRQSIQPQHVSLWLRPSKGKP